MRPLLTVRPCIKDSHKLPPLVTTAASLLPTQSILLQGFRVIFKCRSHDAMPCSVLETTPNACRKNHKTLTKAKKALTNLDFL